MSKADKQRDNFSSIDGLSRPIRPTVAWEDVDFNTETTAKLTEICRRLQQRKSRYRHRLPNSRFMGDKGLIALFAGPSGTDKKLAAELIAKELASALMTIDLSAMVRTYVNETGRILKKVLDRAERTSFVLFFDEADALFGERSSVKDGDESQDVPIDTAYLLYLMKDYYGLVILSIKQSKRCNPALMRCISYVLEFQRQNRIKPVVPRRDRQRSHDL